MSSFCGLLWFVSFFFCGFCSFFIFKNYLFRCICLRTDVLHFVLFFQFYLLSTILFLLLSGEGLCLNKENVRLFSCSIIQLKESYYLENETRFSNNSSIHNVLQHQSILKNSLSHRMTQGFLVMMHFSILGCHRCAQIQMSTKI
jgi:hypothetical protein